MKIIREFISVLLVVILAFSASITAFSAESIAEFLGDEYTYAGELIEGWNSVCGEVSGEDVYVYCSVKVESSVFYS